MTPFQEELYRLFQDARKETNAFTSAAEDQGGDLQKIVKFAEKWDFKSQHDKLAEEKTALQKKYDRDKLLIAKKATQYVIRELCPIIDQVFILQNNVEKNGPLDRGTLLMLENLERILTQRKGGIIRPKIGDELDPAKHKAIAAEEIAGHRGNTISEVCRYGYFVLGTVIREAEVKVRCGTK